MLNLKWILFFVLFIIFVLIFIRLSSVNESFLPVSYQMPDLYPTTAPVDMLMMKKYLLADGYRFQNTLFSPYSINHNNPIDAGQFPESFRKRTGTFKFKTIIENFQGGASQGTMAQLKSKSDFDQKLSGSEGDPIESSNYRSGNQPMNPKPDHTGEVNYKNSAFSWGDIIHRFYRGDSPTPPFIGGMSHPPR